MVKKLLASLGGARDTGSIPGLGRSPGGGNGNPLQYSCLKNSMDKRSLAGYSWSQKTQLRTHLIIMFALDRINYSLGRGFFLLLSIISNIISLNMNDTIG